jgi:hypothetical protein
MREARRFRANAIFADARAISRPLDRNQQARILFVADQLERRTKLPGKRNGALGYIGLAVLRALLLRCFNRRTGLCCPSYVALESITGLCRDSIAKALARLEASGILKITRRLVRKAVARISPITGYQEVITATVQDTNCYSFSGEPRPIPLPAIAAKVRPFPARRVPPPMQFAMSFKPSLPSREVPDPAITKRPGLGWRDAARVLLAKGSAMK